MGRLDKPRFAAGPGKTVTASTSPLSFPITCHGCLCNVQDRDCEALVPTYVAQNSMSAVCHDTLRRANPPQIKLLLLSWANELWNALPWGTFCAAGPTEIVAFPAATVCLSPILPCLLTITTCPISNYTAKPSGTDRSLDKSPKFTEHCRITQRQQQSYLYQGCWSSGIQQ